MDNATEQKHIRTGEESLLNRVMQQLVDNAYSFTVVVMCLVHAVLFVVFLSAGVWPLANYNFSV